MKSNTCSTCGLEPIQCRNNQLHNHKFRQCHCYATIHQMTATRYRIWFTVSLIGNVALIATIIYAIVK